MRNMKAWTGLAIGIAVLLTSGARADAGARPNSILAEFAFTRNAQPTGTASRYDSTYFGGVGVQFSRVLAQGLLLSSGATRDSLAAEVGLYYYEIQDFGVVGDRFSVLPVEIDARYSLTVSDLVEPFIEAGVLKNFVVHSTFEQAADRNALGTAYPAIGAGVIVHLLPSVAMRASVGYEQVGLGIGYQF